MARIATRDNALAVCESILRPYSRIVFSRDPIAGLFVLLATAVFPALAAATLLAVTVAAITSLGLGFGKTSVLEGSAGCIAVLTTLATTTAIGTGYPSIVILGAVCAVFLSSALQLLLSRASLPVLSLPFVLAAWAMVLLSRTSLLELYVGRQPAAWSAIPEWAMAPGWLDIPAAILFVHGALSGGLLLAAILWSSRISFLLAGLGGAMAALVRLHFLSAPAWSTLDTTAEFNALLTAIALGGIWFVPHPSAILLAAIGGALASVATYALAPVSVTLSLPLLSLPFALTTLTILAAMRMRENDRSPASAPPADTPEEALENHLMRIRRFGEFAWLPFRLPFRGPWLVTQGHLGKYTHKGPWRYAFDFEVRSADGTTFEGSGKELKDYRCYNLPVIAAGAGTVDQVIDGIADNPIGGINARDNWGNVVVIAHGSNLYSVVAHLKPKSITVKPGDLVKAGAEIGRCGNSGRSSVPHLHFQVQRGAILGSETIPADFGDVVSTLDGVATVSHRSLPNEGDIVRPVVRDQSLADALSFAVGSDWLLTDESGKSERAKVEVDLWSRRILRSETAALYLEPYDSGIVFVAFRGDSRSLLRHLLPAVARIPFDHEATLAWRDRVPRRLLNASAGKFIDLLAVVAPRLTDMEVSYSSRRTESTLVVNGSGDNFTARTTLSLNEAPHTIEISTGGVSHKIQLVPLPPDADEGTA